MTANRLNANHVLQALGCDQLLHLDLWPGSWVHEGIDSSSPDTSVCYAWRIECSIWHRPEPWSHRVIMGLFSDVRACTHKHSLCVLKVELGIRLWPCVIQLLLIRTIPCALQGILLVHVRTVWGNSACSVIRLWRAVDAVAYFLFWWFFNAFNQIWNQFAIDLLTPFNFTLHHFFLRS